MSYEKIEIGRLVALRQGFAINKKTNHHISDEPTNLHLLRIGDMKDGNFSIFVKNTISEKFIAKENDIIFTRTGQVGLVFRKQYGVVHNNCFTVTTIDEDVLLQEFIYYALQEKSFYEEAVRRATGAAQPDLSHSAFNSIQIYLPPIEKQRKITNILNAYDILIENNKKQIKLLEEAAERLYREWFVDLHFPGYEDVKVVDGVPEGWKRVTVTDLLDIKYGKDHKKLEQGYVPVYGSGGIMRMVKPILYSGESVLIPRKGSLNNILYVFGDFWTIDTMFYSIPKVDRIAKYIYHFLKGLDMYSYNIGAAVPSMTVNILSSISVICPTQEVLQDFDKVLTPLYKKISLLKSNIDLLVQSRDLLLPKLMSGEIEV